MQTASDAETAEGSCGTARLIYLIGLDPLLSRAVRADLSGCVLRRRDCLQAGQTRRRGPRPDLVLLDISTTDAAAELTAVWSSWDAGVVVIGFERTQPFARVWYHPRFAQVIEVVPGFLEPYLLNSAM